MRWYSRIPDKKLFDNFENLFSSWNSCNLDAFLRDSYCKKKVPWHKLLVLGCSNRIIRTTCLTFKIKQVCVLPFDDRQKTRLEILKVKGISVEGERYFLSITKWYEKWYKLFYVSIPNVFYCFVSWGNKFLCIKIVKNTSSLFFLIENPPVFYLYNVVSFKRVGWSMHERWVNHKITQEFCYCVTLSRNPDN